MTRQSFFEGIKKAVAGNHLFDISNAIADYVEPFGYGIVEELVGHGIGHALHEDPQIPNFRQKRKGIRLMAGDDPGRRAHDQHRPPGCRVAGRRLDRCNRGRKPVRSL